MAESIVKFDEKGDGPARYTIFNYQKNDRNNGYDYQVSFFMLFLIFLNTRELMDCALLLIFLSIHITRYFEIKELILESFCVKRQGELVNKGWIQGKISKNLKSLFSDPKRYLRCV